MIAEATNQTEFYREFLMAREFAEPREHGVDMERDEFADLMTEEFGVRYKGQWSLDELLLHPREALAFCDDVKRKHGMFDMPDDIILREIMRRRKRPNA